MIIKTGGTQAIVPVKGLNEAKGRLSFLPPDGRREIVLKMVRTTLRALTDSRFVDGTLVVTSDAEVAELAKTEGAIIAPDNGGDLNAAFASGMASARLAGAQRLILMPSDFLMLDGADLDDMITRADQHHIALLPCKNGTGTNLIILNADTDFRPEFGEGSFVRHWAQAGDKALQLPECPLAFDIDTRQDLERHQLTVNAAAVRNEGFGDQISYSPKVFLPLTQLCRDTCHYCTFAKSPRRIAAAYMTVDQAVKVAADGAKIGCKEALFTLGDRPEMRYSAAQQWLEANGFASTLHYVAHVAREVRDQTGLLPHINAGCMTADEMAMLRPVSASMGLMLESTSTRLCEKGGPHHGSPDKLPAARLATIEEAGRQNIPFTSGILIGIGETRAERIDALEAIHALHQRYGHIQEIIIQNFLPKAGTKMANHPPAPIEELCWTISTARMMFGSGMSIQAPPNLNEGHLGRLIDAGINDWGGVSPLTPDFVNPEAPWPEIAELRDATVARGKQLVQRLTIYPRYIADKWIAPEMKRLILEQADSALLARDDEWRTGRSQHVPLLFQPGPSPRQPTRIARLVDDILSYGAEQLGEADIAHLFTARGSDYHLVCEAADTVRKAVSGDVATYVVNRNINYTNICTYKCNFCAFSKGTRKHEGAERPYLLNCEEIGRRVIEARDRGATEVCLQGGIHPKFTGETYIEILHAVKNAVPDMHIHAFSPLEISHGAATLGLKLDDYLALLRDNGLGSLPGTAAEILHDPIRQTLCPDKLSTSEWLEVIEAAHDVGLRTTATIMFGHVDSYRDWAIHLGHLRHLQMRTGGFTEFVPLAFVAHEAPLYKRGQSRPGPTLREAVLMHAVSRLTLSPGFANIQASWVKMGREGMKLAMRAGANDLGGTLMDESITRAAGAQHGQEMTIAEMRSMATELGRTVARRTTLYAPAITLEPAE
jgi:FO synthase